MNRFATLAILPFLAACVDTATGPTPRSEPMPAVTRTGSAQSLSDYRTVVARVEPVAERTCREMNSQRNCDFLITVDNNTKLGANAYQTYDKSGRPVIAMTPALLRLMKNHDEIAFVIGHEAAHHIRGHIAQTQSSAQTGAIFGAVVGSLAGLDSSGVELATNIGGTVGARRYSKGFELQADALGARIVERAGYDALRGVLYFQDAADPGDQFLGTHPPNADRLRVVRDSVQ